MKTLRFDDGNKVWFSSDCHIGHSNICGGTTKWIDPEAWPVPYHEWKDDKARKKFCFENGLRDFATVEAMNDAIIDGINSNVKEDDHYFNMGDWAFGHISNIRTFRSRIKCRNVHFIYGNHDKHIYDAKNGFQSLFSSVAQYRNIEVEKQRIFLIHYAMRVYDKSHHGAWALYGHSHGSLPDDPNSLSMDVGVDTNNMLPYNFHDIKKIMAKKNWKSVDHHKERE